jgi:aminoglycoside phosphotransferase (APT) family kinase protein
VTSVDEPPYGFDEDAETRRLLRSRPPRAALVWAGAVLGGTVVSARALRGGLSSAMHAVTVALSGGGTVEAVLRRYVRADVVAEEPDIAAREAGTLRLVESLDLPTPRLLGADHTGSAAGVPAVLMSRLPGKVVWSPSDMDRWLRRLADPLPTIHAATPPAGTVRPFDPYAQQSYDLPGWARWPAMWERAVEIFHGPRPDGPETFIHRDFHPGNVLWRRGAVTGVVDWQSASVGPPAMDVGHCRCNLLPYGRDAVDRFTAMWEDTTGLTFHPWADVVAIIGFLDYLRDDPPSDRYVVEDALARSVAELG